MKPLPDSGGIILSLTVMVPILVAVIWLLVRSLA